ncbi:FMN-dependent NADH-azoreductase [Clostridium sp. DSM 8431]|uniref:FMN-dependent NADH-azoreductase n=1 Tax=Clostridium sp. DSM 8431 TaxID=1761781 RepID=UPI0008F22A53|nr:NAD(P)H-dependent oxidoreductase [Clostridium sp. DSM 8431]SFU38908.1 FMN-dependent NADH-azoreductase [Clostridium sp. DSM 8431]
MKKILYIKANIKPEGESRTFKISDKFVEEYKKNNPEDEVIILDLYKENIDFLKPEDLSAVFGPKTEDSKNHPILKYAYQFADADKYIISAPMWNLSLPAIVKAYFDYTSVTGITFKYTAEGAVGLCEGKKAVIITTRGGQYSEGERVNLEMGERYVRTLLDFYGINDVESITAENLDVMGVDVEGILNKAMDKAVNIAKEF